MAHRGVSAHSLRSGYSLQRQKDNKEKLGAMNMEPLLQFCPSLSSTNVYEISVA